MTQAKHIHLLQEIIQRIDTSITISRKPHEYYHEIRSILEDTSSLWKTPQPTKEPSL